MAVRRLWLAGAGAAIVVLAIAASVWPAPERENPSLGLFSSLPIYWNEPGSVSEALDGGAERHWVRAALEEDYRLLPLDTLDGEDLRRLDAVIMAQPRPLAPGENVALDDWVRNGGRLLLFADPFLTEHSRYTLGDKRRPQDVVLLSPILRRWGLELTFDEGQTDDERQVAYRSVSVPERLAGRLRLIESGAPALCALAASQLIAECRIGAGQVLVVADAALLEADRSPAAVSPALSALIDRAFAR